ncbi:hypothetical protein Tsubulata_046261 [Turnera subulata]|uniref:At1g61320/AtMIF1 LRR domain-containing protein n=1 Tax=Turnera subulata TaxID=218843 RepID=A0A9Q0F0J8_9ROSI|nr:hypothetical protein Tsubulata_046261 [Turnera subulata]
MLFVYYTVPNLDHLYIDFLGPCKIERIAMSTPEFGKLEVDHDKNMREKHSVNGSEDLFDQLPDHIFPLIISSLTLKEAAITSAISKRWWSLWPQIPAMNFERSLHGDKSGYKKWVNQVLNSQRGSTFTIDQFSIDFELDSSSADDIDRWLGFAFARRVRKLEFFLNETGTVGTRPLDYSKFYTFPEDLCQHLKTPAGLLSIKCLTSLSLRCVNVTGEIICHFLSCCPSLEQLVVDSSNLLVSIKVVGPSPLWLKHLDILRCPNFISVELCVPNLVHFGYEGREMKMRFGNTPFLSHVFISEWARQSRGSALFQLSGCFSHLETLELHFLLTNMVFPRKAELTNLKQLKVWSFHERDASLLGTLDSLMKGAPLLEKLTLQFATLPRDPRQKRKPAIVGGTHHYPSLKMVEMYGFTGGEGELELALFLFEKAIKLEKIVVDLYSPRCTLRLKRNMEVRFLMPNTRERIWELREKVPPGVEFIEIMPPGE